MPDIAEDLKRKVNLGYSNDEDDVYTVATENGVVELSTYEVNEKIVECVDTYVGDVCEFLESKKSIIGEEYQLYLTGGGISYLKGIKTYFLTRFGLPVEILSPKVLSKVDSREVSLPLSSGSFVRADQRERSSRPFAEP